MPRRRHAVPRRRLVSLLALLAGFALVPAAPATAHVPPVGSCPSESVVPTPQNIAVVRQATLCLVNRLRALHGARALPAHTALQAASQRHAADMVARRYFSHTTRGGPTYLQRLYRSGYRIPGRPATFGEALGYDYGERATPRGMLLSRVLLSRLHHDYLMGVRFQHVGIGIVAAPPFPQPGFAGATYVFAVGRRL